MCPPGLLGGYDSRSHILIFVSDVLRLPPGGASSGAVGVYLAIVTNVHSALAARSADLLRTNAVSVNGATASTPHTTRYDPMLKNLVFPRGEFREVFGLYGVLTPTQGSGIWPRARQIPLVVLGSQLLGVGTTGALFDDFLSHVGWNLSVGIEDHGEVCAARGAGT